MIYRQRYRLILYNKLNECFVYDKFTGKAYFIPSCDANAMDNISKELKIKKEIFINDIEPLEHITIAITYACNLKCKHCFLRQYKVKPIFLKFDVIKKILYEAKKLGLLTVSITGGEPFLHKDILKIIKYILSLNFAIKTIETNGTMITNNIIKKLYIYNEFIRSLSISLDGPRSIHDYIRGYGTYDKIIKNIKNLINNGFNVVVVMTVSKQLAKLSCDELKEFFNFLNKLGIKGMRMGPPLILVKNNNINLISPSEEDLIHFLSCINTIRKDIGFKLKIGNISPYILPDWIKEDIRSKNRNANIACGHIGRSLYIRPDGEAIPCPIWNLRIKRFGNVNDLPLKSIWKSFLEFKNKITQKIQLLCGKCPLFVNNLCGFWNICIATGCPLGHWSKEVINDQ